MTKIDVYSGFLGAGKTTLIKKMIKEAYAGEKLVLIENEFGDIGIDGSFLQDSGIEITEMNSGCICCSLVGDFGEALGKVLTELQPDRILIEPSGVGKLSDVLRAIQNLENKEAALNACVTVVDASKAKMYIRNFGEFFKDQVAHAGCVVLSHTDRMTGEKIDAAVALLREVNDEAVIMTTSWDALQGEAILSVMEEKETLQTALDALREEMHEHHHEHHHEHNHEHEHDEHCTCGCHDHDHDHHEHDEHDEHCTCGCHDHEHEHHQHEHHHENDHDHEHEHHHEHHHEHGDHCTCGCHDHGHHHADEVFMSWGAETAKRYSKAQIEAILSEFTESGDFGMILRSKGVLADENGEWIHFDYVPGEADIRTGTASVTGRICVIGAELNTEKLEEIFGIKGA